MAATIFISTIEEYDNTYSVIRSVLKSLGLRLTFNDSNFVRRFWNCYYCFTMVFGVIVTTILEGLYLCTLQAKTFEDTIDIYRVIPCMSYVIVGIAKSYKMTYQRPVYENLINELRAMWPQGCVSDRVSSIVTASVNEIKLVTRGYQLCNNVMYMIYITPSVSGVVLHLLGYDALKTFPFSTWLPFDPYRPYIYEFLVIYEIWAGYTALMSLVVADLLFVVFISHISTQFNLLANRIETLMKVPLDGQLPATYPLGKISRKRLIDEDEMENLSEIEREGKYEFELKEIIKTHQVLLRLANDVENLNSFALLLNFCNGSFIICACGFCSVVVEKFTDMTYKSILVTILIQTWLLCYYGQKLTDSSTGIAEALYNSGWYTTPKNIRSTIMYIFVRSQERVKVTAYGFSVVCINSYTMILKTSWSYFTLLLNMYAR